MFPIDRKFPSTQSMDSERLKLFVQQTIATDCISPFNCVYSTRMWCVCAAHIVVAIHTSISCTYLTTNCPYGRHTIYRFFVCWISRTFQQKTIISVSVGHSDLIPRICDYKKLNIHPLNMRHTQIACLFNVRPGPCLPIDISCISVATAFIQNAMYF